jgi:hypothetical protein
MILDLKFMSNRLCLFDDKTAGHQVVKGNMKVAQQLTLLCYTQTRLMFHYLLVVIESIPYGYFN